MQPTTLMFPWLLLAHSKTGNVSLPNLAHSPIQQVREL